MLNRPASFFLRVTLRVTNDTSQQNAKENPLARNKGKPRFGSAASVRAAAQDVRGQKALRTFHEFIFHGFALVKGPVSIFLDSGKVDEDVLPG